MLPNAEPAASILATYRPRRVPCSPSLSFLCLSCFSISVALAGKIAGKASSRQPMPGPRLLGNDARDSR